MKEEIQTIIGQISKTIGVPVALFNDAWRLVIVSSTDAEDKFMQQANICRHSTYPDEVLRQNGMTLFECHLQNDAYYYVVAMGRDLQYCQNFVSSMLQLSAHDKDKVMQIASIRTFLVNQLANIGFNPEMKAFIAQLGYHDDIPRCAMLFSSEYQFNAEEKIPALRWEPIFSNCYWHSPWCGKEDMYGICGDQQFLVFKVVPDTSFEKYHTYLMEVAESFVTFFRNSFKVSLHVCIGDGYSHISQLNQSFKEAVFLKANRNCFSQTQNNVLFVGNHVFEYFCSLLPVSIMENRFAFIDKALGGNTKMLETMYALSRNNMNFSLAAKQLGIHRNTLMQRYNHMKALFSFNPQYFCRDRMLLRNYVVYRNRKTILRTGNIIQQGSVLGKGMMHLSQLINQKSGGSMVLEIQNFSISGNNGEFFNLLCQGSLDVLVSTSSTMDEATNEKSSIIELPFIFDSSDQARTLINHLIVPEFENSLSSVGAHCLGIWSMGWRYLTSAVSPIVSPVDMIGKKVRIMYLHELLGKYLRLMGAITVQTNYDEVMKALEAGIVECQENPFNNILAMGFYKYQKFITDLKFQLSTEACFISQKVWLKLSSAQKEIINSAMEETTKWLFQEQQRFNEDCGHILVREKGMQLVTIPANKVKEWKDIAKILYAEYPYPDLLKKVLQAKKNMRKG